jgi:SAM-dependent methyltransferase
VGNILNIFTPLHKSSKRDHLARMVDGKVSCMDIAKEYGQEFWDGDRRFGYGGYKYDGRWQTVAEQLIEYYNLPDDAKILDVGCGKGFLLYEFKKLLPDANICGFDISSYALDNAKLEIREFLFKHKAQKPYPFTDDEFDLVISLTTLHNLEIFDLKPALSEIERVGKNKYIVVESYRDNQELFNLQCWALTCESFYSVKGWQWLFVDFGYTGDYEFIFF